MDRKYCAHLKIKEFYSEGCFLKNVYLDLRRSVTTDQRKRERYDFSKLIRSYSEDDDWMVYSKESILELFTQEEIDKMKGYFEQEASFPQIEFFYYEQTFPLDSFTIPFWETENCHSSWTFKLQDGDNGPIEFEVAAYVRGSNHEKISRKPKEDLFEKYNLFYAFENVFDGFMTKGNDRHYLAATNDGEMLEGFTALLLIKKRTPETNVLTLLNKMLEWINGEDVLEYLDYSRCECIVER